MEAVFTYGTLEIPEIMQAVTGRSFESCEARAPHFACFLIKDRTYPGMTSTLGHVTLGRIYLNVDAQSLWLLDQFEDKIYRKETIPVETASRGLSVPALAYIISPEHQNYLSNEPWRRQDFIDRHLYSYLEACRQFHQRMSGLGPTNECGGNTQPIPGTEGHSLNPETTSLDDNGPCQKK